ncbi:MAG: Ca-activated chloride channel family protein [Cognaticolwellia sp.]|jgi:Ca-activated chloride channel family protein
MPRTLTLLAPLLLLSLSACSTQEAPQEVAPVGELEKNSHRSGTPPAEANQAEAGHVGQAEARRGEARGETAVNRALPQLPASDKMDEGGALRSKESVSLNGLVGSELGTGGLGTRGSGLGGGGTAEGIGGLGTKGRGTGTGSVAGAPATYGARTPERTSKSGYSVGAMVLGARGTLTPDPVVAAVDVAENTEGYVNYGTNDMTLVEGDRFSTFAVDVDTASYAMARRKLNEGLLPDHASVRVEEFVNAMDYAYKAPAQGSDAPFAVFMEAAPSPWEPSHHVMRVAVQGMELTERPPVHLTFLVDTSGSMSQADKLPLAQEALMELVEGLGPQDTVALGTYAGSTQMILGPTSASQGSTINAAIAQLRSGGGTAMSNGMEMAYQMASESYVHGHENRVIVLSDGDANIGRTSHEEILRTVQHHAEEGITLTTVGFGMGNYQDAMMEQLANKGDGNYFYVDTAKEARKVFGEDLAGTLVTIAKDVKIQVEFNPDAVIGYRLLGYENRDIADKDFRNDRVDAGEIGSGHAVTALYDVVLRDGAEDMELATVRLRAKKPGPDSVAKEWATTFSPAHMHSEIGDASADLRLAVAVASFAELLRGSPYAAELRYSDVLKLAQGATLRGVAEHTELLSMIEKAALLAGDATGGLVSR